MKVAITLLIIFLPIVTNAAVTIHEVAWMGSTNSANHEWIELFNSGSNTVSVEGWVLTDGMNLNIPLTGSIAANTYAVLERSSDDSAPRTAFLMYTGALINTGTLLVLKRADGSIEDQVSGGDNWQSIGGDNVTKETAQYTTSGWITAEPTPGKENKEFGTVKESSSASQTTSSNTTGVTAKRVVAATGETVRLLLPDVTLKLEVSGQSVGYVNQGITFLATASGIGDTLIDSLNYEWNFGDGSTAAGPETKHAFAYPGTYVVTAYGSFKRQEQAARHEITILPVTISLTRNKQGDVQINNDSPYEIDISNYTIAAGKTFVFPARSVMLPMQTVTLPLKKTGYAVASIHDAAGRQVVSEQTSSMVPVKIAVPGATAPVVVSPKKSPNFTFATTTEAASVPTSTVSQTASSQNLAAASTNSKIPANTLPYLGLLGVMMVGTLGLLKGPSRNQID